MLMMKTEPRTREGAGPDMLMFLMLFLCNIQWDWTISPAMDKLLHFRV